MWIWCCSLTFLFTVPSTALIGVLAELAFWRGSRRRQPWKLTSGAEMCMWNGLNVAVGRAGKNGNCISPSSLRYPNRTSSVLLAQGNTLLCHYTVCIHIDFLRHHHPLWGNVNNAWRSPIARCWFFRLLLSGTHSYLTCNFLWRSIVLQRTIIHFHLPVVLPWDVEIKSCTLDTVNREYKVHAFGVESTLNIAITPLVLQKKIWRITVQWLHHFTESVSKQNLCLCFLLWQLLQTVVPMRVIFSFSSSCNPSLTRQSFLFGDLRAIWASIPRGSLPFLDFSLLILYPMDLRHWHLTSIWIIPAVLIRVSLSQSVEGARLCLCVSEADRDKELLD